MPRTQQASGSSAVTPAGIQIDLTLEDAQLLADALIAAAGQVKGGGLSSRSGRLRDTTDVAGRLHVHPGTIRGWLARGGPKSNPFPRPDQRYRGRSYWKEATIDAWVANHGRQQAAARSTARHR